MMKPKKKKAPLKKPSVRRDARRLREDAQHRRDGALWGGLLRELFEVMKFEPNTWSSEMLSAEDRDLLTEADDMIFTVYSRVWARWNRLQEHE